MVKKNEKIEQLDFVEAAKIFKCSNNSKNIAELPSEHHRQVQQALATFTQQAQIKNNQEQQVTKETISKKTKKCDRLSPSFKKRISRSKIFEEAIDNIKKGRIQALEKEINKIKSN